MNINNEIKVGKVTDPILYGSENGTCAGLSIPQQQVCCIGNTLLLLNDPICEKFLNEEQKAALDYKERPKVTLPL